MELFKTIIDLSKKSQVICEISNKFPIIEVLHNGEITFYGSKIPKDIKDDEEHKYVYNSCVIRDLKDKCDLLYIDTINNFKIKKLELDKYSPLVNKFILIRGTEMYSNIDQLGAGPGLLKAIDEFIKENKEWKIKTSINEMDGLTVLEKKVITPEKKSRTKSGK